jgi:hypothetical protein
MYCRFVKNIAEVARLLHGLTMKDCWEWGPQTTTCIPDTQGYYLCLTNSDTQRSGGAVPHRDRCLELHVWAVLSQRSGEDQTQHPIAFFSKSITAVEINYGISDKEALAVVRALQHWRHWLEELGQGDTRPDQEKYQGHTIGRGWITIPGWQDHGSPG